MNLAMQPPHRRGPTAASGGAHVQPGAWRSRGRQRLLAVTLVLAAVLLGLDTVLWFRLERALNRRLGGFVVAARDAGWRFGAGSGGRGGWPMAATLTLIRPSLRGALPLLPGGIEWSGDSITLSLPLLHPDQAVVLAGGTQTVAIGPGSPAAVSFRFWAARLSLRLPASRDPKRDGVRLHADALHVAMAGAGPDDIAQLAELTARVRWRLAASSGADTADAASLSLFLRDVAVPARFAAADEIGSARIVQRARLEATLIGRLSRTSLPILQGLALWQRSGGRLQVHEASFDWGGSKVALSGTAWLHPDGAAEGAFALDAVDVGQALRRMREAGFVGAGTEQAMQAVLGLIASAEPGPHLRLPLVLSDGTLALGQIPLLQVPRLPLPP